MFVIGVSSLLWNVSRFLDIKVIFRVLTMFLLRGFFDFVQKNVLILKELFFIILQEKVRKKEREIAISSKERKQLTDRIAELKQM